MIPPLNQSIQQVGPTCWQIGSLICERIEDTPPADALAAWKERDCTYIIRKARDSGATSPLPFEPSHYLQLVHEGGSLSAVWAIGREAFCKVKAWDPAMESEDKTIAFVKYIAPQISTPEVIYTWTNNDRSFLILKRIEGSTLRDAWASLSPSQRELAITTIAHYCNLLAQNTSPTLSTVSGKCVLEPYLAAPDCDLVEARTYKDCASYFSGGGCPTLERVFHFYHPDLGPGNIIVSDGYVAGIIDWEAAGYYPLFWIATKPSVSPGLDFCPSITGFDNSEWRKRFRIELERTWGFPQANKWFEEWRKSRLKT